MNFIAIQQLRMMFTMCLITILTMFIRNEYKYSRYSLTRKSFLKNITTINSTTDPSKITTNFIFLPGANISRQQNLTDSILNGLQFFNNIANAVILNRRVSICNRSHEWNPAINKTKYSPEISKNIYDIIQIGKFAISEDLNNKMSPKTILVPSNENIYK